MTQSDSAECSPRVMVFVPQYPYPVLGGLERQSHELSKALASLGIELQVLSGKIVPEQPDSEEVEGISVTRMRWFKWKSLRFALTPFYLLLNLWRQRGNYDVIHQHQHSWIGLYLILVARFLKKPVLTKLPNVGELGIPGIRKKSLGWLRLVLLRRSSAIVAMSEISVQELIEIGYPRNRILTVPNGIVHSSGRDQAVDDLSSDTAVCRVVFAGRMVDQKCVDVLLKAWSKVQLELKGHARLELWGGGPLEGELKRMCKSLEIEDSVVFAGHLQDVATRLRAVDVFVLPSMVEGNSNAVLEAMEAGLPIVATPVGGTPMQVGPEGARFLFPVGEHQALSENLLRLIQDPGLRRTSGQAMSERIGEYFDLQKVASSYIRAYRELVFSDHVDLSECAVLPSIGEASE